MKRHRAIRFWLWVTIVVSAVLSFAIFAIGVWLISIAPDKIDQQRFWSAVKDIGPAIAGSWVLCAALLAVTASGVTSLTTVWDSETRSRDRGDAIRRVCIGEIKSFWDRCNNLQLQTKLKDHIQWLENGLDNEECAHTRDVFRRNIGDDWFSFFRVDPEALGELEEDTSSRYLSLSANVRHLTSRLNWLNGTIYKSQPLEFWITYHNNTLQVLGGLYQPSEDVLRRLGDKNTDVKTFKFQNSH